VASYKQQLLGDPSGNVLEMGRVRVPTFDTFRKMAFNGFGVEPNAFRDHYHEKEAAKLGVQIEVRNGTADDLPVPDTIVDAVVSTLVLCCVADQRRSIQEKCEC
jgi:hypothetical protein